MNIEQIRNKVKNYLSSHRLCAGLGSKESACTIAAINLAIYGRLTADRPECVCPVIHGWVIPIQDAMPDEMRNNGWTKLVPLIAGSYNPEKEKIRKDLILQWMWETVLPQLTPAAEKHGFGAEWNMLKLKIAGAADAAYAAAYAAADAAADAADCAAACAAADAAAHAARAARAADAYAADAYAADAYAADAATAAAHAAHAAAYANAAYWEVVNPTALLEKLLSA